MRRLRWLSLNRNLHDGDSHHDHKNMHANADLRGRLLGLHVRLRTSLLLILLRSE
ncbi:hypothetical protein N8T08_009638 [Aspergillus melleus]|uniref:Uncharacterized protein n=1 Tax=Aspergillus melleus TaxID=138277 RepID=A0ACC3ATC0_9EURO|nr:hypothetical protein N8T08_009638 [Aspergillus melleus]